MATIDRFVTAAFVATVSSGERECELQLKVTQDENGNDRSPRPSMRNVFNYAMKAQKEEGLSAEDTLAIIVAGSKLSTAEGDGPRDEQWDGSFAATLDALRDKTSMKTYTRTALADKAVADACSGWSGVDVLANSGAVKEAFAEFLYADPAGQLAKPVERKRGKQNVSLKPAA